MLSEGVFLPDGTFLPLPKLAIEPFLKLWEQEVFGLLLAEGKITEEVVANIRSWKHSGFNGWYSNKKRGQRARAQPSTPEGSVAQPRTPSAREARKRWAALIKQVYETNPLTCPKCGSEMKIIAFIERRQTQVVEKLRCAQAHVLRVGD